MNLENLKQALVTILASEDSEMESSLGAYFRDVQTKLNSPDLVSIEILTAFLTQMHMLLFQNEGEYLDITFCDTTYRIQSLCNSYSFVSADIERSLLTPLEIKADTSQETIQACALELLPTPPASPKSSSPLRYTQTALDALTRFAQSKEDRGKEVEEQPAIVLDTTGNNDTIVPPGARRGTLGIGAHPLEFNTTSILLSAFGGLGTMFRDALSILSEEAGEHIDDSFQHGLW